MPLLESNGGQAKSDATVAEIRFAVAEPGLDIGNVETVLDALAEGCYYLAVGRNRHHFSLKENLNKRFADRRATIPPAQVKEQIREEIQKVFSTVSGKQGATSSLRPRPMWNADLRTPAPWEARS